MKSILQISQQQFLLYLGVRISSHILFPTTLKSTNFTSRRLILLQRPYQIFKISLGLKRNVGRPPFIQKRRPRTPISSTGVGILASFLANAARAASGIPRAWADAELSELI